MAFRRGNDRSLDDTGSRMIIKFVFSLLKHKVGVILGAKMIGGIPLFPTHNALSCMEKTKINIKVSFFIGFSFSLIFFGYRIESHQVDSGCDSFLCGLIFPGKYV